MQGYQSRRYIALQVSISCCPKVWMVQQCLREMAHKHLRARTACWCDVCSWCVSLIWKGPPKSPCLLKIFSILKVMNMMEKVGPSWDHCFDFRRLIPKKIFQSLSPLRKESAEQTAKPSLGDTGFPWLPNVAFGCWCFLIMGNSF